MCVIKINFEERALVHTKTAQILRPSCFDTLVVYHSYLESKKMGKEADDLLKKVFAGEKVISDMIEQSQKYNLI